MNLGGIEEFERERFGRAASAQQEQNSRFAGYYG
jgi:hypothetical protein